MKKILFFLLIVLSGITFAAPDAKADSTSIKLNAIVKRLDAIEKNEKEITTKLTTVPTATNSGNKDETTKCKDTCKTTTCWQYLLVLLPCILFILFVFITLRKMQSAGFSFKQAFYNDEPEDKVIQTDPVNHPNDTVKVTLLNKDGMPVYYPSTSRLIAFLSGLTTLIVVVSFMSYYGYCMLDGYKEMPKFDGLSNLIMGLGLGVVPYGVSRVATSLTKPPANT